MILAVILAAVLLITPKVSAQNVQNFTINSFEADYYLSKDSSGVAALTVTEKIVAMFPDYNQNHGIERALPKTYRGETVNLSVEGVTNQAGEALEYSEHQQSDNNVLKIGNANTYVHGSQTYLIHYRINNVIRSESASGQLYGYDELYWDVNGDDWAQQFNSVAARLHIPPQLASRLKPDFQPLCYNGAYGSDAQDCTVSATQNGEETIITIETKKMLPPHQTLTFAVAFNTGTFQKYIPPPPSPWIVAGIIAAVLLLGVLPPVLAFVLMFHKWRQHGKDPEGRGVIVPQYQPLEELNPIMSSVILRERMETKAVSATIIDLCVKGYLKLYEVEKKKLLGSSSDYELELLQYDAVLDQQAQAVINMLFSGHTVGSRVQLSNLSKTLYTAVRKISAQAGNIAAGQGYFELSPEKARKKYQGIGVALLVIGFIGLFFFFIGTGLLLAGIIIIIFAALMPKRTPKGVEARDYLKGVEMYMKLAEADRIKFLQSPETAEKINTSDNQQMVKLYEKLLPYAMLFGIEKEWAKQFADLYQEGQSPSWYSGQSAFNAVLFSSALSSFNTAAVSSFAPPSSSGSSGFSSGGGFSGGGGGGGGGGGW